MTTAPEPQPCSINVTEKDIPRFIELLVSHYKRSTMNMCPHQPFPSMSGQPLNFSLKPDAVPHAVYTPATIPVHWQEDLQKQLGILKRVHANESTVWQNRMLVVRKLNRSPRLTVDMKKLNADSLR